MGVTIREVRAAALLDTMGAKPLELSIATPANDCEINALRPDYYSLISHAVARLDESTGETRRALYDCARAAQVNQPRKIDPPPTGLDFERERLALEDAIRRVESVCRVKLLISEGAQRTPSQPPRGRYMRMLRLLSRGTRA